jgi:hypothetical protein
VAAEWCAPRYGSSVRPRSWRTCGPRRLRRQFQPALVASWDDSVDHFPFGLTPILLARKALDDAVTSWPRAGHGCRSSRAQNAVVLMRPRVLDHPQRGEEVSPPASHEAKDDQSGSHQRKEDEQVYENFHPELLHPDVSPSPRATPALRPASSQPTLQDQPPGYGLRAITAASKWCDGVVSCWHDR